MAEGEVWHGQQMWIMFVEPGWQIYSPIFFQSQHGRHSWMWVSQPSWLGLVFHTFQFSFAWCLSVYLIFNFYTKRNWAKLSQLFLFLFCKHKKPINDARHAWDSFGRMPNKIRAINSCTLIADICHFSPQVQFLAKFVSTQNWINRDKIGFASKQCKSQKTA